MQKILILCYWERIHSAYRFQYYLKTVTINHNRVPSAFLNITEERSSGDSCSYSLETYPALRASSSVMFAGMSSACKIFEVCVSFVAADVSVAAVVDIKPPKAENSIHTVITSVRTLFIFVVIFFFLFLSLVIRSISIVFCESDFLLSDFIIFTVLLSHTIYSQNAKSTL